MEYKKKYLKYKQKYLELKGGVFKEINCDLKIEMIKNIKNQLLGCKANKKIIA